MICGKYVKTFADASHALPDGMHMDSDYPFMLPKIKSVVGKRMTIVGSGGQEAVVRIIARRDGEVAFISQVSTFERLFRRPPQRFKLFPFKDQDTPAINARADEVTFVEESCPGHVASEHDAKVCRRCGVHIDSLRPDDDDL